MDACERGGHTRVSDDHARERTARHAARAVASTSNEVGEPNVPRQNRVTRGRTSLELREV